MGFFFTFVFTLRVHSYIAILLFSFTVSCTNSSLLDSFHDLQEDGWSYNEILNDTAIITNPGHYHQVYANIRINTDYPFSNIQLKLSITKPDSTTTSYPISVDLAEKSGKWLGSGLGSVITFQLPILHRKIFDQAGKYLIKLEQNMRLENVTNVISAGIRIDEQEEIY